MWKLKFKGDTCGNVGNQVRFCLTTLASSQKLSLACISMKGDKGKRQDYHYLLSSATTDDPTGATHDIFQKRKVVIKLLLVSRVK